MSPWQLVLFACVDLAIVVGLFFGVSLPASRRKQEQLVCAVVKSISLRCPDYVEVVRYSVLICNLMGEKLILPPELCREMEMAVKLRGIGLTTLPYDMLQPGQVHTWSLASKYVFDRHPVASQAMVSGIQMLKHLARLIQGLPTCVDDSNLSKEDLLARQIVTLACDYSWNFVWYGRLAANEKFQVKHTTGSCGPLIQLLLQVLPSESEAAISHPV